MDVPKVGALQAVFNATLGAATAASGPPATGQFLDALKRSLEQVNQAQQTADSKSQQFLLGKGDVTLEDAVISQQKANISFQEAIQVRNKLVTAYTDIMNMQI
jgi:flagellar hook-basal body complex protein FliE